MVGDPDPLGAARDRDRADLRAQLERLDRENRLFLDRLAHLEARLEDISWWLRIEIAAILAGWGTVLAVLLGRHG